MHLKYRLFLLALIIIADQSLKQLLRSTHSNLLILNKGISFGLLSEVGNAPLSVVNFLLTLIFFAFLFKKMTFGGHLSVILITGGSIGNLVDRLSFGGVFDYVHLWILPVFNFSDLAIAFGSCILLFKLGLNQKI